MIAAYPNDEMISGIVRNYETHVPEDTRFVLSVQHTGTWFAISLIRLWKSAHFEELKLAVPERMKRGVKPDFFSHLHHHCDSRICELNDTVLQNHKTVLPVRDPLLSLITRQSRHPTWRHRYIVDGFCWMAEREDAENAHFYPVDLGDDADSRFRRTLAVAEHWGMPPVAEMGEFAKRWEKQNATGSNWMKVAYRNRRLSEICDQGLRNEIEYLQSCEGVIRPFLERQGYKDLIWWS